MKVEANCPSSIMKPNSDRSPEHVTCPKSLDRSSSFEKSVPGMKLKQRNKSKNNIFPPTLKNSSIIWKPKSSIGLELCESNYSQIAKRLYSLVNCNISSYQLKKATSCTNGVDNDNVCNNIRCKEMFHLQEETKPNDRCFGLENPSVQDHGKLRGFLKQISVEKSGLAQRQNENIINKSFKSKFMKDNPTDKRITNTQVGRLPTKIETLDVDTNTSDGSQNISLNIRKPALKNNDNKMNLVKTKNTKNCEFDGVIKDINMNSSNCIDVKGQSLVLHNMCHSNSLVPTGRNMEPISLEQSYRPKKNNTIVSFDNKSLIESNFKSTRSKDSIMNQCNGFRERPKFQNNDQTKNKGFRICSDQTKYQDEMVTTDFDNTANSSCYPSNKFQKSGSKDNVKISRNDISKLKLITERPKKESINILSNKVGNDPNPRIKFSRKLFRIFTHSGQISKKGKMVLTCMETVNAIALEHLINLITILSVELILSSTHTGKFLGVYRNLGSKRNSHNTPLNIKENNLQNNVNQISATPVSILSTNNGLVRSKRNSLEFDFNGRVILNDRNNQQQGQLNNSLNHGSLRNINNSGYKNSSTLSIPGRYGYEKRSMRSQKLLSHSIDRNSFLWNRLNDRRNNNPILSHEDIRNIGKADCRFNDHSTNQDIANKRKLRYQETYQFKFHDEECKKKLKENFQRSYQSIPLKSASSIFPENKSSYEKSVESDFPLTDGKDHSPHPRSPSTMEENRNYKFSKQIKTRLDLLKVDEISILQNKLYRKCDRSTILIRQSNPSNSAKLNIPNRKGSKRWFLHIESPTMDDLRCSIGIVARRFPEWNLQQYIPN